MFDMDDLTEETLCILCKEFESKLKMFVWRGFEVHGDEGVDYICKHFLDRIRICRFNISKLFFKSII